MRRALPDEFCCGRATATTSPRGAVAAPVGAGKESTRAHRGARSPPGAVRPASGGRAPHVPPSCLSGLAMTGMGEPRCGACRPRADARISCGRHQGELGTGTAADRVRPADPAAPAPAAASRVIMRDRLVYVAARQTPAAGADTSRRGPWPRCNGTPPLGSRPREGSRGDALAAARIHPERGLTTGRLASRCRFLNRRDRYGRRDPGGSPAATRPPPA